MLAYTYLQCTLIETTLTCTWNRSGISGHEGCGLGMRLGTHIPTHSPLSSTTKQTLPLYPLLSVNVSLLLYLGNPAVVAVNSTLGVIQGGSITLEVYISGYPTVRSTNIHWYRLNPTRQEITSGATFQDSRRRMILRNVQASAAGTYECEATNPLRGSARIQLQVYGKLVNGCGYPIVYCTALGAREIVQSCTVQLSESERLSNHVLYSSWSQRDCPIMYCTALGV